MSERLTKRFNGGYGLVNVKDDEQDVESKFPNTLQAILDSFDWLGRIEDALFDTDGNEVISLEELAQLLRDKRDGRVVVLPCKVGQTVYTVKEDLVNCRICPNKSRSRKDENGYRWLGCDDNDRLCPLYIDAQQNEGFTVMGKDNIALMGDPGVFGYEGHESFSGIDSKWYLSEEEARDALKLLGTERVELEDAEDD